MRAITEREVPLDAHERVRWPAALEAFRDTDRDIEPGGEIEQVPPKASQLARERAARVLARGPVHAPNVCPPIAAVHHDVRVELAVAGRAVREQAAACFGRVGDLLRDHDREPIGDRRTDATGSARVLLICSACAGSPQSSR